MKFEFPKMIYHKSEQPKIVKNEDELKFFIEKGYSVDFIKPEIKEEKSLDEELILAQESIEVLEMELEKKDKEIEELKKEIESLKAGENKKEKPAKKAK